MVYGYELILEKIQKPSLFISPWLTQGSMSMIYGPRGLGKTWLAMIIAVSLTREKASEIEIGPWKVVRSAGVLFVDGEMDQFMLQERIKILTSTLGEEDSGNPLTLLSAHRHAKLHGKSEINIAVAEFRDEIFNFLEESEQSKILILDNISALASGIDENIKQAWDPLNQWLISLRHLGISVIYIHHSGKDPRKQRGTSGREDALDNVINLSLPRGYNPDMGAWFKINFEKARGVLPGIGLKSFMLRVLEQPNEEGLIWEVGKIQKQNDKDDKIDLIKGLLLEGGLKGKEIAEKVDMTPARVSQIKKDLKNSNLLDSSGVCTEKGKQTLKIIKRDFLEDDSEDLISYFEEN
jgi:KaiC/GvpD/RAD55 family RecA-like ATPase